MENKEVSFSKWQQKGIYLALLTSVISGFSIFLNKYALEAIKGPLYFASVKNLIVGLFLLGVILLGNKLNDLKKLNKKELIYLFLIGLIGGFLPFYLFFTGLSQIPAINGALIHKTLVIWVAIFAILFLKEKFTRRQIIAVLILFSGNLLIGGFKGFSYSKGEFFVLLATILWAFENVLAKKILPTVNYSIVAFSRMFFGSLMLCVATLLFVPNSIEKTLSLNLNQLPWLLLTSLLLLGYVLTWYKALKYAPAISVSAVLVSSTLITNILSAVIVIHTLTTTLLIQNILLLVGLGVLIKTQKVTQEVSALKG